MIEIKNETHILKEDGEKKIKLRKLQQRLAETNDKWNLISRRGDVKQSIIEQIKDSLLLQPLIEMMKPKVVLDLGSGGGFPGLPLAIVNEGVCFHLLESSGKKIYHLRETIKVLSLKNVKIIHERAENMKREEIPEGYEIVVARSVARPEFIAKWSSSLLGKEGVIVTFTGHKNDVNLNTLKKKWPVEIRPLTIRTWDPGLIASNKNRRLLILGGFGKRRG